jgi:hypothetical protein
VGSSPITPAKPLVRDWLLTFLCWPEAHLVRHQFIVHLARMNNDAVSNVKIRDRRGYATLYKFRIRHCVDGDCLLGRLHGDRIVGHDAIPAVEQYRTVAALITRLEMFSVQKRAANHRGSADARAQGDHRQIVAAASGSRIPLRPSTPSARRSPSSSAMKIRAGTNRQSRLPARPPIS